MLCCVCLEDGVNSLNIFGEVGEKLNIAKIIQQHLWFEPQSRDEKLSNICQLCWETLNEFHQFYQQVEKAHVEHQLCKRALPIKEEVGPSTTNIVKLESDGESNPENINHFEGEIDVKHSEIIISECSTKNPLNSDHQHPEELERNIECYPKQNFVSYDTDGQRNPLDDEEDMDDEADGEDMFDDYEPSEISDGNDSSSDDVDILSLKTKLEKKENTKKDRKQKIPKKVKTNETIPKKQMKKVANRLELKCSDEMIQKHIPMACSLCVFVGKTFNDIVGHFREHHPKINPYVMCCDKKLSKRFFLAQHALKHEDPNCFKCLECDKSFASSRGLRAHDVKYHAPEEDQIYSCDLCPKKFAAPNLLEMHKPSHIPKDQWQFFCTKCPIRKSFASAHLLRIHNIMQHKRSKYVCHVCAKELRQKAVFEKHVRLHFEDSGPRLPCPYQNCETWLKDEENLKLHLKRHLKQENSEGITYKCSECNKLYNSLRSLKHHKNYAHSNKTFPCDHCNKTFKKAISLREHMTQHTGETLYKCPFCPRTFNSNANMHAHKKRQHPVEWDEWRRTKKGSSQVIISKTNPLQILDGV